MSNRHCPHCHCTKVIKFGQNATGKQRYRCQECHKVWVNDRSKTMRDQHIWEDYALRGLTLRSLAEKYHLCRNTVMSIIDNYPIVPQVDLSRLSAEEKQAIKVIIVDATYLHSHMHCVIVAIDAYTRNLLYFQEVFHVEKLSDYAHLIRTLWYAGIHPEACVIDGRKGIRELMERCRIKVQYCLFHVLLLEKRCLTSRPILQPNRELKEIVHQLVRHDSLYTKQTFQNAFFRWRLRHEAWLKERTYSDRNRRGWEYTHERTRKLVASITANYQWYFTYEEYPELNIPRTSSAVEGLFGTAKTRILQHRGCKNQVKIKLLFYLLSGGTGVKNN